MHEIGGDHVHAAGDPRALESAHPLWRTDRIVLRSVGIDIGSSTSHLIVSSLELRRQSAVLSSRFELVGRHIDYASPIILTPFAQGHLLDVSRLSAFLEACYIEAGIGRLNVDTGAVITTGDAARKDNAAAVVQLFSEQAGKFVCASAGPLLEAKMAAYGSGAVSLSAQGEGGTTVLNIDIGGGTSKLAIVRNGRVIEATAINVGARLISFDDSDMLASIEAAAQVVARHRGMIFELGAPVSEKLQLDLAAHLVDALLEVAVRQPLSDLARELLIVEPLSFAAEIDAVVFSGGVAEYLYQGDVPSFGDIGPHIARLLRQRLPKALPGIGVVRPTHGIRATVIGASQFTAQVSGNTLHIARPALLPLRNLPVVIVDLAGISPASAEIAGEISRRIAMSEASDEATSVLGIRWPYGPAYAQLDALASGIAQATAQWRARGLPLIVILDVDVARLIGSILSACTGYPDILCIDGVDLREFDYIDIGEEQPDTQVVTVVVKSLVFTG